MTSLRLVAVLPHLKLDLAARNRISLPLPTLLLLAASLLVLLGCTPGRFSATSNGWSPASGSDGSVYVGSKQGNVRALVDDGFDGFVISLAKTFKILEINGTNVFAECGVMMGHFVKICTGAELSGVESLIGVPGTVGGAIRMNAGAYGREISSFLTSLRVMTLDGKVKELPRKEVEFSYRHSSLGSDEIVVSAKFKFEKGAPEVIQVLKSNASKSRKATQPLRFRSAGSIFKNPLEKSAGQLIDQAGLKGTRVGGAEISEKHANFFVNHGDASSEDLAELIRLARRTVREKFDIHLELEIMTLGFPEGTFDV